MRIAPDPPMAMLGHYAMGTVTSAVMVNIIKVVDCHMLVTNITTP